MNISHEEVINSLSYCPETGFLFWVKPFGRCKISGNRAGSFHTERHGVTYRQISIKGKRYLEHRVIWFYVHGYWPNVIDHINGDTIDNRISNLRDIHASENTRNMKINNKNKSGILGVCWIKGTKIWQSRISVNNKKVKLYNGKDFFEACCARKSAEIKYGYHENHGRKPK